ncbi:hypothetical protein D3C76_1416610 [compost metagenome]
MSIGQTAVQIVNYLLEPIQFGSITLNFLAQTRKATLMLAQLLLYLLKRCAAAVDSFAHFLEVGTYPFFVTLSQALKGNPILSAKRAGKGRECMLWRLFLGYDCIVWAHTAKHTQQSYVFPCG